MIINDDEIGDCDDEKDPDYTRQVMKTKYFTMLRGVVVPDK